MSVRDSSKDIAIVGIGAVLPPDGAGIASYQALLESGQSGIVDVPRDRWLPEDHYDPDARTPDRTYCKIGGFVRGAPFKSLEFRIPPRVAEVIDRVQQWALLATREALASAGLANADFDRSRTAILFGNSMGGEQVNQTSHRVHLNTLSRTLTAIPAFQRLDASARHALLSGLDGAMRAGLPEITEDTMAGELANCIAGRVAGAFDITGPSFTVDAACAGSLAALCTAIDGLRSGRYDRAVVGGVDSNMGPETYVKFSKIGALSPDGSRPFDAGANGFVMGEGAAVFVLRRLDDARKAGDRIHAVLLGAGGASDGKGKGITAPNPEGQRRALEVAWKDANVRPDSLGYIECHGTSTPVGDVVEARVLAEMLGKAGVTSPVAIGSVKSQIGHLKGGAGAAGLLKVVLGLERGVRFPSINVVTPNPEVGFGRVPLRVQTELEPWTGAGRRAGVSAFGFGGTNFHLVVESADTNTDARTWHPAGGSMKKVSDGVVAVGADSAGGLAGRLRALTSGGESAEHVARCEQRLAIAGLDDAKLALAKSALDKGLPSDMVHAARARGVFFGKGRPGKVAFIFPGQGSQYAGMLMDLAPHSPEVRRTLDEADAVLAPLLGKPLTAFLSGDESALVATEVTQPAMLACDIALARALEAEGFRPDGAIGHSLGEYAALVCAGALSFADALRAVSARGREMAAVRVPDHGKMASVIADERTIDEVLRAVDGYVVCANKNSRTQTVIAGATLAVEDACARLEARGVRVIPLPVSAAFHTAIVAPARQPLERFLRSVPCRAPEMPVYRNTDGEAYPMGAGAEREIVSVLGAQVESPVEFVRGLEAMWRDGFTHFVEVGPKRVLTGFVEDVLGARGAVAIATNHPKKGGLESLREAVAALRAAGAEGPKSRPAVAAEPRVVSPAREVGIVITGASLGLPGADRPVFADDNVSSMLAGEQRITRLPDAEVDAMVHKNVVRVRKDAEGSGSFELLTDPKDAIHLAGRAGRLDLVADFGLDPNYVKSYGRVTQLGIAAGLEALRDAQLPLVRTWRETTTGGRLPTGWALPEDERDETGIVFASAFAGFETIAREMQAQHDDPEGYRFNRHFLLESVHLAHGQLAQLIKARGPNVHVDAACASTTLALATAEDWIRAGRCKRVIVVGADDVTSKALTPWIVTGFLAAGAATTEEDVTQAALPFDARRHGTICGMGAVGIVVEREDAARERGVIPIAELLGTEIANSAFHGTRLDVDHVSAVMRKLVKRCADRLGMRREDLGRRTIFMSHETYTPARGGSAAAEIEALRASFGEGAREVLVANTKGFTGHPMGAAIEDTVVLKALQYRTAPPIANLRETDPELGPINLSPGGPHDREFALRIAAGFGSQIGLSLVRKIADGDRRIADEGVYLGWLARAAKKERPALEVVARTLRVSDADGPAISPSAPAPAQDVSREIVALVAERTGYPNEMLELDLDLEADLGVDTVKQAEILSELRARYRLPETKELRLKDYPTLRHVIGYVMGQQPSAAAPVAARPSAPAPVKAPPPSDHAARVVALVAARTGYPAEMLELDLDLEADLGIDTVKQAEILSELRAEFGLPEMKELKLKEYPTLRHVIGFVSGHGTAKVAPAPVRAALPAAAPAPAPVKKAEAPKGDVAARVVALVAARTGYPAEMLELDLDLEADLGIDTVKQAEVISELRAEFKLPEMRELKLKDYPTLRHVIGFVGGEQAAPAPQASPRAAAPSPVTSSDVSTRVVALVAARTGYPAEMLELDLDLEADLGIDTVKQAEVISELRAEFKLPEMKELKLKEYPTLRHVIGFVSGQMGSPSPVATSPAAAPVVAKPAAAPSGIGAVLDIVARASGLPVASLDVGLRLYSDLGIDASTFFPGVDRDASLAEIASSGPHAEAGRVISLARTSETPTARSAVGETETMEIGEPSLVRTSEIEAVAQDPRVRQVVPRLRGRAALRSPTGIALEPGDSVLLIGDGSPLAEGLANAIREAGAVPLLASALPSDRSAARGLVWLGGPVRGLLLAAQAMADQLATPRGFLLAFGGHAHAGLCRSLAREWPDAGLVKAVQGDVDGAALFDELCYDRVPAVRYAGGERFDADLAGVVLPEPASERAESDVWVVTGGAQGITGAIVRQVAEAQGGVFHLLGRTPLADPPPARLPDDDTEARRLVLAELSEGKKKRPSPATVVAEVGRRRALVAVADFVASLRALPGVTANYHAADVTDAASVAAALSSLDRVDWLVHGAGVEVSRPLEKKTADEIDRVLGPKLAGLDALLAALAPVPLGAVVTFGSIAGLFGNAAQTDYAAANEGMVDRLLALQVARPEVRTLQIDWTAWSGAGMAARGSVTQLLEAAGIGFLPPDAGGLCFRALLQSGLTGSVCVDRGLGVLEPAPQPSHVPPVPAFFGDDASIDADGAGVRVSWPLQADRSWLDDHRIDGTPVLPGVMGLEAFAQAACALFPRLIVEGFEDVAFHVPLKLYGDRPLTAVVAARVSGLGPVCRVACRLVSRFVGPTGQPQGPDRVHFTATVVLTGDVRVAQPMRPNGTPMTGATEWGDRIYDVLFHGRSFQLLAQAEPYDGGVRAAVNGDRLVLQGAASAPMALEALFQTVGLQQIIADGTMGLPAGARRVHIYGAPPLQSAVEAFSERAEGPGFDAILRDEAGRVYVQLSGYRTATLES